MAIERYFTQCVQPCRICEGLPELSYHITFQKMPPYSGDNPRVLIIGHSPTVRTRKSISMTLDLDNNSRLKGYISNEILSPLGLNLEQCAATNLVKCITTKVPEDIKTKSGPFMNQIANVCIDHLKSEIESGDYKLLISMSERVSLILQKSFEPDIKPLKMKNNVATMQHLCVNGRSIPWIPVVHFPKPKTREYYMALQRSRLNSIKMEVLSLLGE